MAVSYTHLDVYKRQEHPLGTESSGRDMLSVLLVGAPRSLRVGLIAATIGMLIGVLLGFTAGYMGGWVDAVIRTLSDAIIVIPVLAVLIVIGSYVKAVSYTHLDVYKRQALGMRGMMITTAGEDYMILAQAKGLTPSRIFWLYGVRNSILPQVTALTLSLGGIVGGAVLVEYIFAYPGIGYLLYQGLSLIHI